VYEPPEPAVEPHRHLVGPAERAVHQDLVAVRHALAVGVWVPVTRFLHDLVRRSSRPDEETEAERRTSHPRVAPDSFRTRKRVGESLRLLERQEPEGEARPRRDAAALAGHAVVQRSRDEQAEVGLGLAAASGEPDRVDNLGVVRTAGQERQGLKQETHLEWPPPGVAPTLAAVADGGVHQREGLSDRVVVAE
jgi:hypothetical protein